MGEDKPKPRRGWRGYWHRFAFVTILLVVLWVPFYNRLEPTLFGVPFFYWYQLLWILIGAAIAIAIYLIDTRVMHLAKPAEDLEAPGPPGDVL